MIDRRVLVLVLSAACGRVGFDAIALVGDSGSIDAAAPSSGLIAWYKLDDGAGTQLADSSGSNILHTDLCGAPYPAWIPGRFGSALAFDATVSNCGSTEGDGTLRLAGAWTVTAWVRPASLPVQNDAFALVVKANAASQHNYSLWLDHGFIGSSFGFTTAFHDVVGTEWHTDAASAVVANTWYFVAGTWDTSHLTIFVDGAAAGTTTPGADPSATTAPFGAALLGRNECCAQYFDGALDDVRIYNRALSPAEIATLYTVP